MNEHDEIIELYNKGSYAEALKSFKSEYPSDESTPLELTAIRGWCYYRTGKFVEAKNMSTLAILSNDVNGWRLLAQISARAIKDDKLLAEILKEFPNDSAICNAYLIRALEDDSTLPMEDVLDIALRMINGDEISDTNGINNAARIFERKGGKAGAVTALGLWDIALVKYEEGTNTLHHRAAVWFWKSKAYKLLGNLELARIAGKESLRLWYEQVRADPDNQEFKNKTVGAKQWLEEISNTT